MTWTALDIALTDGVNGKYMAALWVMQIDL